MRRDHRFGTGIVWGTIPIGFPVAWVAVPGCSQNGYWTSSYLWVQKKFVKFRQSTQNTRLCPTEFFWELPVTLPSISSEIWEMYSWAISGSSVFCDWLFLVLSGVSLETAASFLLFLIVAMILKGKILSAEKTELKFLFFKSSVIITSYSEGKGFNKVQTVSAIKYSTILKGYNS